MYSFHGPTPGHHLQGDDRYSSEAAIITHDRAELKAQAAYRLSEAENAAHSYSVIGIDEGQFFPGEAFATLRDASITTTDTTPGMNELSMRVAESFYNVHPGWGWLMTIWMHGRRISEL